MTTAQTRLILGAIVGAPVSVIAYYFLKCVVVHWERDVLGSLAWPRMRS